MTQTNAPRALLVLSLALLTGCLETIEPFRVPPDATASYSPQGARRINPQTITCDHDPNDVLSMLEQITFTNQRPEGALDLFILEPGDCQRVLQQTLSPGEAITLTQTPRGAPFVVTLTGQEEPLSAWRYIEPAADGVQVILLP